MVGGRSRRWFAGVALAGLGLLCGCQSSRESTVNISVKDQENQGIAYAMVYLRAKDAAQEWKTLDSARTDDAGRVSFLVSKNRAPFAVTGFKYGFAFEPRNVEFGKQTELLGVLDPPAGEAAADAQDLAEWESSPGTGAQGSFPESQSKQPSESLTSDRRDVMKSTTPRAAAKEKRQAPGERKHEASKPAQKSGPKTDTDKAAIPDAKASSGEPLRESVKSARGDSTFRAPADCASRPALDRIRCYSSFGENRKVLGVPIGDLKGERLSEALFYRARAYTGVGRSDSALATYQRVVRDSQRLRPQALLNVGVIYMERARFEDAAGLFDEALGGQLSDEKRGLVYYNRGRCYAHTAQIVKNKSKYILQARQDFTMARDLLCSSRIHGRKAECQEIERLLAKLDRMEQGTGKRP
jgi:hypothetical protein